MLNKSMSLNYFSSELAFERIIQPPEESKQNRIKKIVADCTPTKEEIDQIIEGGLKMIEEQNSLIESDIKKQEDMIEERKKKRYLKYF